MLINMGELFNKCLSKIEFISKHDARKYAKNSRGCYGGRRQYPYYCYYCCKWHLTTQKR